MLRDPEARLQILKDISFVKPRNIVDIDEMAASPDQYQEKYGWAIIGKKAFKTQIKIGSKHYTVIAAYTEFGFLAWEIYLDGVTQDSYIEFLKKLQPYLHNNHSALAKFTVQQHLFKLWMTFFKVCFVIIFYISI